MKKTLIILSFLFLLNINGCFVIRIAFNNLNESLFSSPQKIENKIANPVRDSVNLSALWIGHSSVLIQIYDKVIIADPFFDIKINGIFQRKKEPGLEIENISKLNLILISHSHMDHLNFRSLDMLSDKFPGCNLVFPEGNEEYLPDFDLNMIRANTNYYRNKYTGEAITIDSIKVTPVYALHQGGRYAFDTYSWKTKGATGYIIQYKDVTVYFAGDTGYNQEAFESIGNIFNIDLALIPIGPCRDCEGKGMWFHTSVIEGLRIFTDIKATYMIPIHYGAIQYFNDADFPVESLREILDDPELSFTYIKDKVKILKEGEQIIWK